MNAFAKNNWKAILLALTLVSSSAGAYTNLLLELGQLRAEVQYQNEALQYLSDNCK